MKVDIFLQRGKVQYYTIKFLIVIANVNINDNVNANANAIGNVTCDVDMYIADISV